MKTKLTVAIALCCIAFAIFAFKLTDGEKQTETYCMIVGQSNLLGTKVSIMIDYGQQKKMFTDNRLKDENGNVQKFNSMIDAMNYMNTQGWQFVNAYAIYNGSQTVYNWMLKKTVPADAEGK